MPPHIVVASMLLPLLLMMIREPELVAAARILHTSYSSVQLGCGSSGGSGSGSGGGGGSGCGSGRGLRAQSANESCPILLNLGKLSFEKIIILCSKGTAGGGPHSAAHSAAPWQAAGRLPQPLHPATVRTTCRTGWPPGSKGAVALLLRPIRLAFG